MKKILSLLFICFLLIGCSSDDVVQEPDKTYKIGEVLTVSDVDFKVTGTSTKKSVGSEYLKAEAKGIYLIVDVTITNNGSESITVDTSNFKLLNDEKRFDADGSASIYANTATDFFLTSLNPGVSLSGKVVFDVSDEIAKSQDNILEVSTAWIGGNKGKISLIK